MSTTATSSSAPPAAPVTPKKVLDFWFGDDVFGTERMNDESVSSQKAPMWFGMKSDYSGPVSPSTVSEFDASILSLFGPSIRAAGSGELESEAEEWTTDEGVYARMILADQMSRNAFRGTAEAFAFDGESVRLARVLFERKVHEKYDSPLYFTFLTTPGQHSEELDDHLMNWAMIEHMERKWDAGRVAMLKRFVVQHKEIVERFGRYPWRNGSLGRVSTAEEQAYLDDYDNLPGFAKSQMKDPKASEKSKM